MMKAGAIAGFVAALAVAVWIVSRSQESGLRADPSGAKVLDDAIAFFESRLSGDPIDARMAGALAGRYVLRFQRSADMRDLGRAEHAINSTLRYAADRSAAHAQLSSIRLMQHDFASAYAAARSALMSGETDDARAAWFDAALATGRHDEARTALAGMDPENLATRVRRSIWLDSKGETEAAFHALHGVCDQLSRARDRPDAIAWCLTELASLEATRSGAHAATRLYRQALHAMPGYRGAMEGLADMDHARGKWRRAIDRYERIAVDAHPDLYLRLAEANRALGHTAEAADWEARFLRAAGPPDREALYARPLAVYWADRPYARDLALAIARRDLARRPAPESWDVLAWVHFRRGEWTEALAASDRAVRAGATSPTTLYRRGRIMAALQRADSAAALLNAAAGQRMNLEPDARIDLDRFLRES